jgi:hypothetical protein
MTQENRFKATATVKFSVDDLFCETEQEARAMIYDDPGGNVEWAHEHGICEVLEVNVENLGPGDKVAYYKAAHGEERGCKS